MSNYRAASFQRFVHNFGTLSANSKKKVELILSIQDKVLFLQSSCEETQRIIEIWCNGSTTDSGSVSEGSNPSISTNPAPAGLFLWLLPTRMAG